MKHGIIDMRLRPGRRVIAISDIHGHLDLFDALVSQIGVSGDDLIVLLGDVVESGKQSLASLRRAMELAESGRAVMLAGNWDYAMAQMLMDDGQSAALKKKGLSLIADCGACLLGEMLAETGDALTEDTDMDKVMPGLRCRFKRELDFMAGLPLALDTGDWFFVHGGVNTLDREALEASKGYGMLKYDAFAESGNSFDRWVVVGHWPVYLYDPCVPSLMPHINREKHIASIDGGCGKERACQLNALIMRAGDADNFDVRFVDSLPRVRALDDQMPSEDAFQITWMHRFVEVLSRAGDMTRVRHIDSGRVMDIPSEFVFMFEGRMCANNYTSNRLDVKKGDVLSVIIETSAGLYCKKNGVIGWYTGRARP